MALLLLLLMAVVWRSVLNLLFYVLLQLQELARNSTEQANLITELNCEVATYEQRVIEVGLSRRLLG